MKTVTVTVNTLFQNATPFEGFLRVKLGTPLVEVDSTFIAQLNPQEIDFGGGNPEVSFLAIPNSLLGEDTYYVVEIYRDTLVGAHHEYDLLHTSNVVIPDYDCNLADITVIEPTVPEPIEASKKYASEAKLASSEAAKSAESAKKAAAAAEYFSDGADEIKEQLSVNLKHILAVGGITMGERAEIYKAFLDLAKTEPVYWTALNSAEWLHSGILTLEDLKAINTAMPTPVAEPFEIRAFVMAGLKNAATILSADQVTIIAATWFERGEFTAEDMEQVGNILDALAPF